MRLRRSTGGQFARAAKVIRRRDGALMLALLSVVAGAATGVIVSVFKMTLEWTGRLRDEMLVDAHHFPLGGIVLVMIGCAGAVTTAAWLVRRFSAYASGSGVPEVEAALGGALPPAPLRRILLIKFVGGTLSIGAGMMLGPEGPGVQMGAVGARLIGSVFRRPWTDLHALIAAGAGAGIAVAFNAPVAGAVFVLEELVRRFDARIGIAGLGASSTAILVSRLMLGDGPEFHVAAAAGALPHTTAATWPLYLALGVLTGAAAVLYSKLIMGALSLSDRLGWPIEAKAAAIGAAIGAVGWFSPVLVGAGADIVQQLLGAGAAGGAILLFLVVRFVLGGACYAARTPGGLFAPLLALGALTGFLFGSLCEAAFPAAGVAPQAFAVVGMAAFFVGVVRAPMTGIVLVIEMTAAFATLLPMLVACFTAMLTAAMLGEPPIYDSLRRRLAAELAAGRAPGAP
jgi:chloride channel protein, CIC family